MLPSLSWSILCSPGQPPAFTYEMSRAQHHHVWGASLPLVFSETACQMSYFIPLALDS